MESTDASVTFEIPAPGGHYYPCRAFLPIRTKDVPDDLSPRESAMRFFTDYRIEASGKPLNAETIAEWPEQTIIDAAAMCHEKIMEKIVLREIEFGEMYAANLVVEDFLDRDDAQALKGRFPARQCIRISDGLLAVRGEMTPETMRMRLDFIADDVRPEREKERRWLRKRIKGDN